MLSGGKLGEACSSTISSTARPRWNALKSNPDLRGETVYTHTHKRRNGEHAVTHVTTL